MQQGHNSDLEQLDIADSHSNLLSAARQPVHTRGSPAPMLHVAAAGGSVLLHVECLCHTVSCYCSCADESIDEIAAFLGVGEQVAALTAQ